MPDTENPKHYKDVFDTPNTQEEESDEQRPVDEFAPRANLKRLFAEDKISLKNIKAIEEFSEQYSVDEEHVSSYVQHLEELKVCTQIRERERQTKKNERRGKSYNDYKWSALSKERKLNSLTKQELKHYLKEHNLSYQGRKEDWIERITTHLSLGGKIINQSAPTTAPNVFNSSPHEKILSAN
jgi:hypothetical protein